MNAKCPKCHRELGPDEQPGCLCNACCSDALPPPAETAKCPKCGLDTLPLSDVAAFRSIGKRPDRMPVLEPVRIHIPGGVECLRCQLAAEKAARVKAEEAANSLVAYPVLTDANGGIALVERLEKAEAACAVMARQIEAWNASVAAIIGRQPVTGIDVPKAAMEMLDEEEPNP